MVGRPRKTSPQTEYIPTENEHLEAKNYELARALAEVKTLLQQAINEKNYYQKELYTASLRIKKLENIINNIDAAARETITSVVELSNHASDIIRYTNSSKRGSSEVLGKSTDFNVTNVSSRSNSKGNMQVVKPMISGHVILRPTINLRRVNEISVEEVESLRLGNNSQRGEDNGNENNSPSNDRFQRISNVRVLRPSESQYAEEAEDNDDELDQSMNSSDSNVEINNGLDPIEEERDSDIEQNNLSQTRASSMGSNRSSGPAIALASTSTQMPLLSGVFKDVRVYLSPVDPHCNVTKIRGSNKSHFKRSSENQPSRISGHLSNNSLTDILNRSDANESDDSKHIANALRRNSCTSTPHLASNVYNENENNFDIDTPSSSKNIDGSSKRWLENNRRHTEYLKNPKILFTRNARATVAGTMINDNYDPLEGPSNLLDSYESNNLKLKTLYGLGLTPVLPDSPSSNNETPSPTVAKRRKRKTKVNHNEDNTPKRHSKLYVTQRKSEKEKKASKTPKLLVSRMSFKSPNKANMRPSLSPKPKRATHHKRRTRKKTLETTPSSSSSDTLTPAPSQSPGRLKSPMKRAKRNNSNVSLKEPSLRKKLRRSK